MTFTYLVRNYLRSRFVHGAPPDVKGYLIMFLASPPSPPFDMKKRC